MIDILQTIISLTSKSTIIIEYNGDVNQFYDLQIGQDLFVFANSGQLEWPLILLKTRRELAIFPARVAAAKLFLLFSRRVS